MAHLKVQKGDTLYLTDAPDGGYRLTAYNPEFERQMALADEIMHEDREVSARPAPPIPFSPPQAPRSASGAPCRSSPPRPAAI
jgi:hypothetical protein